MKTKTKKCICCKIAERNGEEGFCNNCFFEDCSIQKHKPMTVEEVNQIFEDTLEEIKGDSNEILK